ncbi:MAG: hypothetical protein HIU92_10040 [Proteobacteria bacterium]|nr:hypothetical protein [Pseudomonadota bacterium]
MEKARPLLIAVIAMGVLIVVVTTVVIVKLVKDIVSGPSAPVTLTTTMLHQPAGSHIVSIAAVDGRLSVLVEGGGPDRILLVEPGSGRVAGELMLGQ